MLPLILIDGCFDFVLQVAKRGQQRESDLERIQDLFPNDWLRLYEADALTMVSTFCDK